MDALVELVEEHEVSPTAEAISLRADRSKGLISYHFGSLAGLYVATVRRELQRLDATVPSPTDSLRDDLIRLARNYHRYYVKHPFLALMMLQIASDDDLKDELKRSQDETVSRLTDLWEHHQSVGRWCAWIQESNREQLKDRFIPFLGGIFARIVWSQVGIANQDLDLEGYVDAFLDGYSRDAEQERHVADRLISILQREAGTERQ